MQIAQVFASLLYHVAYKLHHKIFLKPGRPLVHAKLYIVGSFLAGGAGKTPFSIFLAQKIQSTKGASTRIAILCHSKAQDEALMLRQKIPSVKTIPTSNRYKTAHAIDKDFDYIICDDGFEDSRFTNAHVIRLDWGQIPQRIQELIPTGKCRSLAKDHPEQAKILQCAGQNPDIEFTINNIVNFAGEKISCPSPSVICGIGNPERFVKNLRSYGIQPGAVFIRPDHDRYFEQKISKFLDSPVIITEKDWHRLSNAQKSNPNIFVAYQQTRLNKEISLFD